MRDHDDAAHGATRPRSERKDDSISSRVRGAPQQGTNSRRRRGTYRGLMEYPSCSANVSRAVRAKAEKSRLNRSSATC